MLEATKHLPCLETLGLVNCALSEDPDVLSCIGTEIFVIEVVKSHKALKTINCFQCHPKLMAIFVSISNVTVHRSKWRSVSNVSD